jgi:hypothetical protein
MFISEMKNILQSVPPWPYHENPKIRKCVVRVVVTDHLKLGNLIAHPVTYQKGYVAAYSGDLEQRDDDSQPASYST